MQKFLLLIMILLLIFPETAPSAQDQEHDQDHEHERTTVIDRRLQQQLSLLGCATLGGLGPDLIQQ